MGMGGSMADCAPAPMEEIQEEVEHSDDTIDIDAMDCED